MTSFTVTSLSGVTFEQFSAKYVGSAHAIAIVQGWFTWASPVTSAWTDVLTLPHIVGGSGYAHIHAGNNIIYVDATAGGNKIRAKATLNTANSAGYMTLVYLV